MSDWGEGYVIDVPYLEDAYPQLMPSWLSLAALLNGQPPIDLNRAQTYVELGCGNGLSSLSVAACLPNWEVWACDFNPSHVSRAQDLIRQAALTNCTIEEASFEHLNVDPGLGPTKADIIVMHGIYSWVSPANQRHIVEFVRQRLKPGGMVYVSYNALPGWASMLPLRDAIKIHADTDTRSSNVALAAAISTMKQIEEDGAATFPLGLHEQRLFDSLESSDPSYTAHEYLAASFDPMMFGEVATDFAAARCSFLGSAQLYDYLSSSRIGNSMVDIVASATSQFVRESICDVAAPVGFRQDIYRRGLTAVYPAERERWFDQFQLIGLGRSITADSEVATDVGPVSLDHHDLRQILDQLTNGPLSLRDVGAPTEGLIQGQEWTDRAAARAALLVSGGFAVPASKIEPIEPALATCRRLNRTLIEAVRDGRRPGVLAAPVAATVIRVDPLTMLAIGEVWDGIPEDEGSVARALLSRIERSKIPVLQNGTLVNDRTTVENVAGIAAAKALTMIRKQFVHLGI